MVSPLLGILYAEGKSVAKDHDMALEILHIMMDTKQETKRKSEKAEALYRKLYEEKYRTPYSSVKYILTSILTSQESTLITVNIKKP